MVCRIENEFQWNFKDFGDLDRVGTEFERGPDDAHEGTDHEPGPNRVIVKAPDDLDALARQADLLLRCSVRWVSRIVAPAARSITGTSTAAGLNGGAAAIQGLRS
jgi:hypothetical protein